MKLLVAGYMEFIVLKYPEHIEYHQPCNFLRLFLVDKGFLNFKVFKIKLLKFKFSKLF